MALLKAFCTKLKISITTEPNVISLLGKPHIGHLSANYKSCLFTKKTHIPSNKVVMFLFEAKVLGNFCYGLVVQSRFLKFVFWRVRERVLKNFEYKHNLRSSVPNHNINVDGYINEIFTHHIVSMTDFKILYNAIHDFLVLLRTSSNPADMNQI